MREFFAWRRTVVGNAAPMSKALVQAYAAYLRETEKLSAAAINQQLSAIRKLVSEAADNQLLDANTAMMIKNVRGARREGRRTGNWLSKKEAQA